MSAPVGGTGQNLTHGECEDPFYYKSVSVAFLRHIYTHITYMTAYLELTGDVLLCVAVIEDCC